MRARFDVSKWQRIVFLPSEKPGSVGLRQKDLTAEHAEADIARALEGGLLLRCKMRFRHAVMPGEFVFIEEAPGISQANGDAGEN